jgi:ABC-type branched-subunit amino acid transport system substrate-binding protein
MYKRRFAVTISLLIIASLMLGSCTAYKGFIESFKEDEAVKIGIFEPFSGEQSTNASSEIAGIELAYEMQPEINGKPVILIRADNCSTIDDAKIAAKELVSQDVHLVLGSFDSTLSIAGADIFAEAGIPAVAITNTNPVVTSSNDIYFRVCPGELPGAAEITSGATFLSIPFDGSGSELSDKLLAAYAEAYERAAPNMAVAYGFDAYMVACAALTKCAPYYEKNEILAMLFATEDFEGAAGKISFDSDGNRS